MKCPHCGKEFEMENSSEKRGEIQKSGMIKKANLGKVMSKPAYGYKIEKGKLIKDQEKARKIQELFLEFLKSELSLNKLAKKYCFSVNGLKKILSNFTYIGKIKFNGEIHSGNHEPLISSTDFNHVQEKLEIILKKKD